jgi:hypothetical protein
LQNAQTSIIFAKSNNIKMSSLFTESQIVYLILQIYMKFSNLHTDGQKFSGLLQVIAFAMMSKGETTGV